MTRRNRQASDPQASGRTMRDVDLTVTFLGGPLNGAREELDTPAPARWASEGGVYVLDEDGHTYGWHVGLPDEPQDDTEDEQEHIRPATQKGTTRPRTAPGKRR